MDLPTGFIAPFLVCLVIGLLVLGWSSNRRSDSLFAFIFGLANLAIAYICFLPLLFGILWHIIEAMVEDDRIAAYLSLVVSGIFVIYTIIKLIKLFKK